MMGVSAIGETLPLPPGERVGVRGRRGVIFGEILLRFPPPPGGRGDLWTLSA